MAVNCQVRVFDEDSNSLHNVWSCTSLLPYPWLLVSAVAVVKLEGVSQVSSNDIPHLRRVALLHLL